MSTAIGGPPAGGSQPAPQDPEPAAAGTAGGAHTSEPASGARACKHCGAALEPSQDWCLQCGAGAPGSIEGSRWRPGAAVAAAVVLLAVGAGAVAYAAANQHAPKRASITKTVVALAPAPATSTQAPATSTTGKTAPSTRHGAKAKLPIPLIKNKLPKIPLTAITPPPSKTSNKASASTGSNGSGSSGSGNSGSSGSHSTGSSGSTGAPAETSSGAEASAPSALLLDTDAASTYNPYDLPAGNFGDPSLTIDGDRATAWTALVDPTTAPAMAEGVLVNLKSLKRLSALELVTETPGMTVQVYGTAASSAPDTIVSQAWAVLSAPIVIKKHDASIALRLRKKSFRFVVLWISRAPADQLGSAQAPGHVTVNELELFPVG